MRFRNGCWKPARRRRVVALLGPDSDLGHVLRRIYFDADFAPASIQLAVGGRVTDRVVIAEIVSDVFNEFFHFVQRLWEICLAASDLRKLLPDFPLPSLKEVS